MIFDSMLLKVYNKPLSKLKESLNMTKIIYYKEETDDVVTTAHQDYRLPDDFQWVKKSWFNELISCILGKIWTSFAWLYCYCSRIEIRNRQLLEKVVGTGYVIYANHTQPFGDVVTPFVINGCKRRVHSIAHPSNLALPVIGQFLPLFGVLPTPQTKPQYTRFLRAIKERLAQKGVIFIYPEQEMWFNYRRPRQPKRGAYLYAAQLQAPIISCFTEMIDRPELESEDFYRQRYRLHILEVIYPDEHLSVLENSRAMCQKDFELKKAAYERIYGKDWIAPFDQADIAGWRGE